MTTDLQTDLRSSRFFCAFLNPKNKKICREVVNRLLVNDASKKITSVEKMNYLRCLYREGKNVSRGTCCSNPCHLGTSISTWNSRGTRLSELLQLGSLFFTLHSRGTTTFNL